MVLPITTTQFQDISSLSEENKPELSTLQIKVNKTAENALNELTAPVTGGVTSICSGLVCGFTKGAIKGAICGALCTVALGGASAGVWIAGEKLNNEDMVFVGRVGVLFSALPIIIAALCGGIRRAATGAAAGVV
ncbi:MAG: hypothetical protein K0S74_1423 [Chlamydiales bacterium]|jgi:hypothetical protein|nr:hypothetical protein [Chlamydiales bacterium]